MDPFDFSGKIALVTGSSQGIGAGIVSALGKHGARCVVNYFAGAEGGNKANAEKVAAELPGSITVPCDVSDAAQVASMIERVKNELGGLDILVNNAGVRAERETSEMTDAEWETVLGINLTGVFNCIRAAIPMLRDGGRIVNISSVSGQMGFVTQANYSSSKAGVIGLTKVVARELAPKGITVNAIAPGFIKTAMSADLPEFAIKKLFENLPMARFGDIEDIVHAALFLCSGDAGYITGQVLGVNGGLLM